MNVLLVEDQGAAAYYIVKWLEEEGHVVLMASNLNVAQDYWDNRSEVQIHCIILDLNMSPDGLTNKQKQRSEGGLLSGWVWLHDCVLSDEPEARVFPSGLYDTDRTMFVWPINTAICLPSIASHNRMLLSSEAEIMFLPSGLYVRLSMLIE